MHMRGDAQPRPRWLSLLAFVVTASCVLPVTPAAPAETTGAAAGQGDTRSGTSLPWYQEGPTHAPFMAPAGQTRPAAGPHGAASHPMVDLDAFYSADVEKMAAFLGPELHFHHGLESSEVDVLLGRSTDSPVALDEPAAPRSLADAVRVLYPHIPLGASVLDVGCGWCGPAKLLAEERAASVRGVTIARAQAEFCRTRRDVKTLHADVEEADVNQMLRMEEEGGEAQKGAHRPMHGPTLSPQSHDHL